MSGWRRLLDLITFVNASRNVAAKHAARQREHLDVRARTSSVTKGVKAQTDRVAVAVQAASELARRLDESGPDPSPGSAGPATRGREQSSGRECAGAGKENEGVKGSGENASTDIGPRNESDAQSTVARGPSQEGVTSGGTSASAEQSSFHNDGSKDRSISDNAFEIGVRETDATVQGEPPEGVVNQLFRSRRVANTLFGPRDHNSDRRPFETLEKGASAVQGRVSTTSSAEGAPRLHDIQGVQSHLDSAAESSVSGKVIENGSSDEASIADGSAPQPSEAEAGDSVAAEQGREAHQMLESRVPSSRLGRLWEYGGLAASMAFGVVGEGIRRSSGSDDVANGSSLLLSPGNIERLVNKLSKMRGAALKLGQMMSFQGTCAGLAYVYAIVRAPPLH